MLKEAVKESAKNTTSYSEINKKMSPNELISKGDKSGISGSLNERNHIENEVYEKSEINKHSDYSPKINESIRTTNELKIYQNADLREGVVNDRPTLKDISFDSNLKDANGRTNLELMEKGRAPIDAHGEKYNLHHIGQKMDSPLAELQGGEHRIYHSTLHDTSLDKSIIDRGAFDKERAAHWKARADEIKERLNV
ncbi:MAG: HNH/ENDO VII family nuclease [Campylobacterota bacterium]|nr:HNH/ENDO VII family nuclease [Campylobacterota bacterium]